MLCYSHGTDNNILRYRLYSISILLRNCLHIIAYTVLSQKKSGGRLGQWYATKVGPMPSHF